MRRGITYFLPCKPGSVYINVTDRCLNNCLFCIKREGPLFFGNDLSLNGQYPEPIEIINCLKMIPFWNAVKEVVFCGMGEPLLRYECVMEVCQLIKDQRKDNVKIRIDTSGLFWAYRKKLDILDWIDVLSVSLNAENAEKYEELCRPKINMAYDILINFLKSVKRSEVNHYKQSLHFPDVYLSIVDTSEEEYLPASGREGYPRGEFPSPDFEKCNEIAKSFNWSLLVKKLFRDSQDKIWNEPPFFDLCAQGKPLDMCRNCSFRH